MFVNELRVEVKRKETQLDQILDGRQDVYDEPIRKYVTRSTEIEKQWDLLDANKISTHDFLNALTCVHNKTLSVNLCDVERIDDEVQEAGDITCLICGVHPRSVMMLPCNHFVVCNECNELLPGIHCAECNQPTTGFVVVVVT